MALPAQPDAADIWRTITAELQRLVSPSAYEIWLAPVQLQSFDGERLLLRAPTATEKWLTGRFGPVLQRCVNQVLGPHVTVSFAGTDGPHDHGPAPASAAPTGLHPRYRFEQFIIGEGNRLAHAAALAVAELPGQAYNPLFLHAPPGLGKTHLLHAIGNYVLAFGGGATVRYTTAESFTNHFITALSSKSLAAFKHAYRDADVLLIDDVQFLASKARTEEEFFHTFNALYENGRQLVLTCDRLPRALVGLEQRLRERFEAGLVADIKPPDHATRVAILRKRAALDGISLADPGVLELIADRVIDNIRSLEGALIRVVAFHSLTQRPIDRELTLEVLDAMYPRRRRAVPSIAEVQKIVAGHFNLSVQELTSASRASKVAWPRQVAIHLARDLTGESLPSIGRAFGGRNHATVMHACKRVSERLKNDQQVVDEVATLAALVTGGRIDRDY
ncbi:MAG TPA: chromosomal replication initiator protein DnaA [Solirubrobacteraceae bacterium]|nr:chromosomal replication initiator protein DnaA [Solirubrobacteraceae bacterium]